MVMTDTDAKRDFRSEWIICFFNKLQVMTKFPLSGRMKFRLISYDGKPLPDPIYYRPGVSESGTEEGRAA